MFDIFVRNFLVFFHQSFLLQVFLNTQNGTLSLLAFGEYFEDAFFDNFIVLDILDVKICEGASSIDVEGIFLRILSFHIVWYLLLLVNNSMVN
jgi:hypothetical protein